VRHSGRDDSSGNGLGKTSPLKGLSFRWDSETGDTEGAEFTEKGGGRKRKAEEGDGQDHVSVPRSLHSVPHKARHSGRDDTPKLRQRKRTDNAEGTEIRGGNEEPKTQAQTPCLGHPAPRMTV